MNHIPPSTTRSCVLHYMWDGAVADPDAELIKESNPVNYIKPINAATYGVITNGTISVM